MCTGSLRLKSGLGRLEGINDDSMDISFLCDMIIIPSRKGMDTVGEEDIFLTSP